MNPPIPDSLCNMDQFSRNGIWRRASRRNRPVKLRLTEWRLDPRMPLRRELPPLLFGGAVGGVLGLLLTASRSHAIFFSQAKIRYALICRHSAIP
jgi:hypothetical protein